VYVTKNEECRDMTGFTAFLPDNDPVTRLFHRYTISGTDWGRTQTADRMEHGSILKKERTRGFPFPVKIRGSGFLP
jgi:hypothetical protein